MRDGAGVYLAAVLAVGVAFPKVAVATCDPTLVPQALVARIDKPSIDKILAPAGGAVPEQLPIDGLSITVSECGLWFDDNVLHVTRGDVRLANPQVSVVVGDGGLDVAVHGNLDLTAHLDLELCALPDTSCDARVIAQGANLSAHVAVAVNECSPQVNLSNVVVRVDGSVDVDVSGCPIYDTVFDVLDSWFHDQLLSYGLEEIQSFIPQIVSDQVQSMSTNLVRNGAVVDGITFKAQPEQFTLDSNGLSMSLALKTEHQGIADCVAGIDWRRSPAPPLPVWPALTGASIGVSERFVQNIVESAWKAGWLCLDLATIYPEANTLVAGYGVNPRVRATAGTLQPPRIEFLASDMGEANITIGHLQGHLVVSADDKPDLTADFLGGFSMKADTKIRQATNEIVVVPRTFDMTPFDVVLAGTELTFTQESVEAWIRDEVTPVMATGVAELPVMSALFQTSITPIDLARMHTIDHGFIAEVHIGEIDTTDDTPPVTEDDDPPQCPCDGSVDVTPTATDDTTPGHRMRWLVEIDGKREPKYRFGDVLHIDGLGTDRHIIHVAGVDTMGNVDPVGFDYDTQPLEPSTSSSILGTVAGGGCAAANSDACILGMLVFLLALRRATDD